MKVYVSPRILCHTDLQQAYRGQIQVQFHKSYEGEMKASHRGDGQSELWCDRREMSVVKKVVIPTFRT